MACMSVGHDNQLPVKHVLRPHDHNTDPLSVHHWGLKFLPTAIWWNVETFSRLIGVTFAFIQVNLVRDCHIWTQQTLRRHIRNYTRTCYLQLNNLSPCGRGKSHVPFWDKAALNEQQPILKDLKNRIIRTIWVNSTGYLLQLCKIRIFLPSFHPNCFWCWTICWKNTLYRCWTSQNMHRNLTWNCRGCVGVVFLIIVRVLIKPYHFEVNWPTKLCKNKDGVHLLPSILNAIIGMTTYYCVIRKSYVPFWHKTAFLPSSSGNWLWQSHSIPTFTNSPEEAGVMGRSCQFHQLLTLQLQSLEHHQ